MPAIVRTALAALALAPAALVSGAAAAQDRVHVHADEAEVVRLPGDASAVLLGNPAIADATLYDARTVFVTGKSYGRTNLVAVSEDGAVLFEADVTVGQNNGGLVQVYRNTGRTSYLCAPQCVPSPLVGDAAENFDTRMGQMSTRSGAAQGGAGSQTGDLDSGGR